VTAHATFAGDRAELESADFQALATMAYEEAGILLPDSKRELVRSRLMRRLRHRQIPCFADYVRLIARDAQERAAAVDALTTNHTSFFREQHHFTHLADDVRREMIKRLQAREKVRIWSAACSSGEEPYSIAMTLLGADRKAAEAIAATDLRILATDLSTTVLERARLAQYAAQATASVPDALARVWVKTRDDRSAIDPLCAELIRFKQLNLMGDWPIAGRFDAIFCRNVMIYFDDPTKERLQARLVEKLGPRGYLYIGHSERLIGQAAAQCEPIGQTMYRKKS